MMCSKCKKRPAVVFLSNPNEPRPPMGLCLICAKEEGVKPVTDMMEKMGIDDDQLDMLQEQVNSFVKEDGSFDMDYLKNELANMDPDELMPGGAQPFPFFNSMIPQDSDEKEQKNSTNASENTNKQTNTSTTGAKKKKEKNNKKRKYLNAYCYNLTQRAKDGLLDTIVGRDREIGRVVQILSRRTKNNPCLIGEPGVGKTAVAEALAIKIANKDVPSKLIEKEIFLLDLTALVAGTQFRGQFESRIKGLIEEVKESGNIILFIDEVHNLVGTGDSPDGAMNAANILKPALSRGEIQVIGATTFNEYRKYIEKDSALERRFQPVTVKESTVDDSIQILLGIKHYYEAFHKVVVSDYIAKKAVIMSERYITDRFLPDKAIDMLDEACAHAILGDKVTDRYELLNSQLKTLKSNEDSLISEGNINYEKLADLRSEIAKVTDEIEPLKDQVKPVEVTEDDLAHVIELWTDIPATKVKDGDLKRLTGLEDRIKEKIISQDEAVEVICAAIKRSRVQISPRRHPASFIFVGPTGVGKTELVKVIANDLFDSPETLIRLDMSEFMEKHSVSKIIGSPPGYVGYDEAGQITEKVRRRPYSVILFDEIEKAHPDVMNILLQILDEGKITDSHGRLVNFENTIIVMTSNAGSNRNENLLGFAKTSNDISKEKAMKGLSEFLRPEFLSRVDEVVVFKQLTESDFVKIAKLMLNEYVASIGEKNITFEFDHKSTEYLAKKAIGGKSGARDLRNLIRREVEDEIANLLIKGIDLGISYISLSVDEEKNKLTFSMS